MRSRAKDVDDFLKGVKELDERTHKEDKERFERIKSTSERELQNEQDRFARMRAREDDLRQQRDKRTQELQIADSSTIDEEPPALPSRPGIAQRQAEPNKPAKPAAKGFIASALRHASPDHSPESPERLVYPKNAAPEPCKPEKAKPSWISSAMTRSKPQLTERKPVGSESSSPHRSRSASPVRPLRPQNAGFDPRFNSKLAPRKDKLELPKVSNSTKASEATTDRKSPTAKLSPVGKPVSGANTPPKPVPSQRTPSQSLKDARSSLAKKPKPKVGDPIKDFREQLVLSPQSSLEKPVRDAAPKLPPRREPSVPEALRNRSLKPVLPVRKMTPPKVEAHERMRTLRPAQSSPRPEEETPEALERMKSLSKPPKLERQAEPEPDALRTLRSLRPSKSIEKQPPPSPEALDRLHSLRRAKPKPAVEQAVPEALKKRENLKSKQAAPKPSLQRSPNTNLRQTSSTVDFRAALSSAIAKGPSSSDADVTSPLRRSKTDTHDQQQPLEHLTKTRARGPKRKLPSSAKSKKAQNSKQTISCQAELQLPKRTSAKSSSGSTDRNFSREELKRLASAKRKPKLPT